MLCVLRKVVVAAAPAEREALEASPVHIITINRNDSTNSNNRYPAIKCVYIYITTSINSIIIMISIMITITIITIINVVTIPNAINCMYLLVVILIPINIDQ